MKRAILIPVGPTTKTPADITFTDIDAKDLCSPITVIVNYNGTDYEFGKFSAEGFALDAANAYSKVPCAYYSTRYEAAKALLFYSQMLDARYGKA